MNWKTFKKLFKTEKYEESQFILGIDLGDATSAICYFDANRYVTEVIDISGGYGKSNVPTVVQYIPDSREWVFGEYAMLNSGVGNDVTLSSIIGRLGKNEYIEIDKKPVSVINILSIYLKELIGSCKNINPRAEIAGIVVSVPNYVSEETLKELGRCFAMAGYDKELIDFVPERECILNYHYYNKKPGNERIMLLDFGSREVRGGVYDMNQTQAGQVNVKTLSYMFDEHLGTKVIDNRVIGLFTDYYCENTGVNIDKLNRQVLDQISAFAYQHKDLIFQKNILNRPIKMYFNFAYPPFQCVFTKDDADRLIHPFKKELYSFFDKLLNNNIEQEPLNAGDITTVLCTGGGFEMLWARDAVEDVFPDSNIMLYKNSKAVTAEGASIIAAGKLGVIDENNFIIDDKHQIKEDIGIVVSSNEKDRFVPIIERNSFWWQNNKSYRLIVNEKTDKPFHIDVYKRNVKGEVKSIGALKIDGLPERPKGVTKIDLKFEYTSSDNIKASLKDCGFGELFPASDYYKEFFIAL